MDNAEEATPEADVMSPARHDTPGLELAAKLHCVDPGQTQTFICLCHLNVLC